MQLIPTEVLLERLIKKNENLLENSKVKHVPFISALGNWLIISSLRKISKTF